MKKEEILILEKVKNSLIDYFKDDKKRISHAINVFDYASQILEHEKAQNIIVLISAYLHDIGILEAYKKHKSTSGKYQEIEGPPIAKQILKQLKINDNITNHVLKIISKHHTLNGLKSLEFQILYEADWIQNLQDDFKNISIEKKNRLIEKNFKTKTGKIIAYRKIQN